MKKNIFVFSAVFFAVSIFCGPSAAEDFFVSPAGTDNPECSLASPCRQIRQAVPLAGAGDTIHVFNGEYLGFDVNSKSGSAGSPLTIKAEGNNVLILPTTDRPDNRDNIFITQSDWIVVDGLKTFNAPRAGLRVDQSHNVTVRNGTFGNNTTWGIFTNHSNDLLIENNETFGSERQHGIYVSNSGDRPVVTGNISYNNNLAGIQINADVSAGGGRGVAGDGIITGAVVEKNTIFSNGRGGAAGINLDGVQDSVVKNNLLYDNHASGIAAFRQEGAAGPSNVEILNNTIDMAPDARWALRIVDTEGEVKNLNNILINRNTSRGGISLARESSPLFNGDVANLISDFNIFDPFSFAATPNDGINRYELDEWQAIFGKDPNSFIADPSDLFIDITNRNYLLAMDSPAINAGILLANVDEDIRGFPRPFGPTHDIGAYEVVPEPATMLLFGSGLVGFGLRKRKKIASLRPQ